LVAAEIAKVLPGHVVPRAHLVVLEVERFGHRPVLDVAFVDVVAHGQDVGLPVLPEVDLEDALDRGVERRPGGGKILAQLEHASLVLLGLRHVAEVWKRRQQRCACLAGRPRCQARCRKREHGDDDENDPGGTYGISHVCVPRNNAFECALRVLANAIGRRRRGVASACFFLQVANSI
jgi:hypothetical protein